MDMNLDKVFYISFNTNTIVHVACQKTADITYVNDDSNLCYPSQYVVPYSCTMRICVS